MSLGSRWVNSRRKRVVLAIVASLLAVAVALGCKEFLNSPATIAPTIALGGSYTCALRSTGAAYCWGDNTSGQLGNGSFTMSATPLAVAGGLDFSALVAGF